MNGKKCKKLRKIYYREYASTYDEVRRVEKLNAIDKTHGSTTPWRNAEGSARALYQEAKRNARGVEMP